jgi:hypothetical protein
MVSDSQKPQAGIDVIVAEIRRFESHAYFALSEAYHSNSSMHSILSSEKRVVGPYARKVRRAVELQASNLQAEQRAELLSALEAAVTHYRKMFAIARMLPR